MNTLFAINLIIIVNIVVVYVLTNKALTEAVKIRMIMKIIYASIIIYKLL